MDRTTAAALLSRAKLLAAQKLASQAPAQAPTERSEQSKSHFSNSIKTTIPQPQPQINSTTSTPTPTQAAIVQSQSLSALERIQALKARTNQAPVAKLQLPDTIARTLAATIPDAQISKSAITADRLNEDQKLAVRLASEKQSFALIGSAGSGKTTTVRIIAEVLAAGGTIGIITAATETKNLIRAHPAIAICSFTNQAVTNIKEAVPTEFKSHCLTIHKLLEFSPVYYELVNETTGLPYKTMRYEPMRNATNPIPKLDVLVIEEAGSVSLHLYDQLMAALPNRPIEILLGDLNQIPPVFGDAILGYKLLELPVVNLKHIYRQDTDSAIKRLAYRILDGAPISDKELSNTLETPGELELKKFSIDKEWEGAVADCGQHFAGLIDNYFNHANAGTEPTNPLSCFNYEKDVLLIPYGKQLGSFAMNRYMAEAVSKNLQSPTYEICAGWQKFYFAVGDIVYYAKNKWRIVGITKNSTYSGKPPQPASLTLNRLGVNTDYAGRAKGEEEAALEYMERMFELGGMEEDSTTKQASSHILELEDINGELHPITVEGVGALSDVYLAYALTVHKSQGSEWEKVFCLFHHSHSALLQREILYTACTRARKHMRIYYSGEQKLKPGSSVFQKGVVSQKIPGNTLEHKLKYFRSKLQAEATKIAIAKAAGTPVDLASVLTLSDNALATTMLKAVTFKHKQENPGEDY